jgi:hypothetical protein
MRALALALGVSLSALAAPASAASPEPFAAVIQVPQDQPTVEAAIDASTPGTLILLDRGEYPGGVVVPEEKPGITIRGVDRNEVVFHGHDQRLNAIEIEADNVTLENMTARNYTGNGFYWDEVEGFAGRYLTVWNVGLYGIYAIESRHGIFEESYVSGAGDAAFYIGECNPCDALLTHLTARYSAIGYSGTNAGGNLEIRDSLWEFNGSAIMPNSFDGQRAPAPQRGSVVAGNTIRDSGTVDVPANTPLAGFYGVGIAILGGHENVIEDNTISGSTTYGIALIPSFQIAGIYQAERNTIRDNSVSDSGTADLGVTEGSIDNCFASNTFATSLPANIEDAMACGGAIGPGAPEMLEADDIGVPIPVALERLGERPDYKQMPEPDPQPGMPNPEAAGVIVAPDQGPLLLVTGLALVLAVLVGALFLIRARGGRGGGARASTS